MINELNQSLQKIIREKLQNIGQLNVAHFENFFFEGTAFIKKLN